MTVAVIVATAMARDQPPAPDWTEPRGDGGGKAQALRSAEPANGAGPPAVGPAVAPAAGTSAESATAPADTSAQVQPAATLPCPTLRSGQAITEPVLGRLSGQLAALGIRDIVLIAPPGLGDQLREIAEEGVRSGAPGTTAGIDVIECADAAEQLRAVARLSRGQRQHGEALLVCAGDLVAHAGALALAAGAEGTAALIEAQDAPGAAAFSSGADLRPVLRTAVRPAGRTITAAGSAFHRVTAPDAVGCGVFLVSAGDLGALEDAAEQLATLAEKAATEEAAAGTGWPPRRAAAFGDPVAMLLVGLVRGGVAVTAADVNPLRCVRVATSQQARAAAEQLHAAGQDTVRMNAAVKAVDGFVATFLVSPYSRYLARWAARREVTPHAVTAASAGLALLAAVWFSDGTRAGFIAGGAFLFGAFVLDCMDGQIARYARRSSAFGSWIDPVSDRVKEYGVYAGLAIGGTAAHQRGVWVLAVAAMIVQAIRYTTGLSYRTAGWAAPGPDPARGLPLDEPADYAVARSAAAGDAGARGAGPVRGAGRRLRQAAGVPGWTLRWLKRIGYLPVGERFVVIAVTAAVAGPRTTFIVLIAWGAVAAAVTIAVWAAGSLAAGRDVRGRRRSRRPARSPLTSLAMSSYRDDGVIAQSLGRLAAGQLPPLLPAIAGVTVTVALAAAGLHYGRIMAIAPVGAMLLAGLGRSHPHDGRLDWLVPPLLRAGEYIYLAALGISAAVPTPIIFALIGVIAVHHYDVACRERLAHGLAPSPRAVAAGLGWEGRMLVIAIGSMLGFAPFAYALLSAYVWILFGWESLTSWLPAPGQRRLAVAQVIDLEDGGGW
jgi:hypothetical protein